MIISFFVVISKMSERKAVGRLVTVVTVACVGWPRSSLPLGTSGGRDLRVAAVLGQSGGGWCDSTVYLVMRRFEASATFLCVS